ncbi:MAG: carboxyltransferase domain-containing protein [Armatimonadetes bacterium]|nr:carboxyltransferase domain-containing protein [Armatimonadota bacterium]
MTLEKSGGSLWIVREIAGSPSDFAEWMESQNVLGVEAAVPCYESVGLWVEDSLFPEHEVRQLLKTYSGQAVNERAQKTHEIPCCYEEGLDLDAVCGILELSRDTLIEIHASTLYRVAAVGFMPGFPYLQSNAPELSGVPRLESPRIQVPAGSVAITGTQCGIYPNISPGGWRLIGRTPLAIADVQTRSFPISPGDNVRFVPISREEFASQSGKLLT